MRRHVPRPRKRFGQHFLEAAWVAKLVEAVAPAPADVVLEIGPGRGAVTRALAGRVRRLIAVEIDRDLAALLRAELPAQVEIVEGDFLDVDLSAMLRAEAAPVRVVGNLPYNVASPILLTLLKASGDGRVFRDATVMLQKEVADRVVACPGSADYGGLAIHTAAHARAERILTLPPGAFRPPPRVTSAVVRLTFRPPPVEIADAAMFDRIVRSIFLQRRKTLLNAFRPMADSLGRSAADVLARAGLDPRVRPATLTLEDVGRLVRAVL
jgi:16S rRNA (adenine1518-N6/adenine1519-N6)-dimethyltransferase